MSSGISFWTRVGSAFRANPSRTNGHGLAVAIAPGDLAGEGAEAGVPVASVASSMWPWTRRNRSLQQLDERYQRMLGLLDALRDHFERSDQQAEQLTAGVDRLGSTLERIADTQRTQRDCIVSIAARVDEAARRSAGLATLLGEMPASLQAQAEAVRAVARQIEASRAADGQLVGSLQQFSRAADSLCDAGAVQTRALQQLHDAGAQHKEAMQAFVRGQTRLLLIITIVVAALGLGTVAALAMVARMVFNP